MERASQIARAMVIDFAMFPDVLPYALDKNYLISQNLRKKIDFKVKNILMERLEIVKDLLIKQNHNLLLLGDELMRKDTLSGKQVNELLGFN